MNDHQCVLKAALVVQVGPPPPSVANLLTFECLVCCHLCDIGMAMTVYVADRLTGEGYDCLPCLS